MGLIEVKVLVEHFMQGSKTSMFDIGLDGFVEVRTENRLCSQQRDQLVKLICLVLSAFSPQIWLTNQTGQIDLFSFFHPKIC